MITYDHDLNLWQQYCITFVGNVYPERRVIKIKINTNFPFQTGFKSE